MAVGAVQVSVALPVVGGRFDGGFDGGVDGGLDGGVKGGVDGEVDGGVEGGVEGAVDGGVDGFDGGVDGGVTGGGAGGITGCVVGGVGPEAPPLLGAGADPEELPDELGVLCAPEVAPELPVASGALLDTLAEGEFEPDAPPQPETMSTAATRPQTVLSGPS